MEILALVFVVCLLWSIARSIRRIAKRVETFRVEFDIPIYGERPDPEPRYSDGKVIPFTKRVS